jgi:hypothetical protein
VKLISQPHTSQPATILTLPHRWSASILRPVSAFSQHLSARVYPSLSLNRWIIVPPSRVTNQTALAGCSSLGGRCCISCNYCTNTVRARLHTQAFGIQLHPAVSSHWSQGSLVTIVTIARAGLPRNQDSIPGIGYTSSLLLSNGYRMTAHLHLMPRSRMRGAIPSLSHTPWHRSV